ncbi:pentatricopeptide repeat-containing protein At3g22150, chloroplastic-like [Ananas comosus]|uniref:Pentatricopeptide repeat-containing protein At3g22150, chloroplastic-like n=1 Tax=Ananas comosus TaxID=4615 RepID=A0A6P5EHS7_ANACO|nr:pentatricopeptide repeat-containing protein At3g22150, chloroplastic-like [Ananas comosus]
MSSSSSSLVPPLLVLCPSNAATSSSSSRLPPLLPSSLTTPAATIREESDHAKSPKRPTALLRARLSRLCKEGRLDRARRLFDSILPGAADPPPTLLWNTLLIGYVCNSLPDDALRLYALMNMNNSFPRSASASASDSDHYTYSSALKACAHSRRLRLGRSIHCHLIRRSSAPPKNPVLNNSLLNMYACASDPEPARPDVVRALFDRMPRRNAVSWNTVVAWYVRSCRPNDALALFKCMIEAGIRPSTVSFVNVFPAVAAADGVICHDALYGLLIKHGKEYADDLFVVSSAICMFSELGDIKSARQVFDRADDKNTEVWNTMINGHVQNGQYVEAIDLFLQILGSEAVNADGVTFLSSLMAISQLQDVKLGQQVHAYLIKDNLSAVPLIVRNALIVMYSRCGRVQSAFDLFCQMPKRDIVSWNTMITCFVQNGFDLEGILLVYEMQKKGLIVDSVTSTALLSAASNLSSIRIGKETHGYLLRHGIQFEGMESYLVDMYAKSGCVETARQLFDGNSPPNRDQVTWNAMIAGYTQSGQTEQAITVFRAMLEEGWEPNAVTLSPLLSACDPVGGIQAGKQIHGFAIRHYLDDNVFVGTALVDMYSKCGDIFAAERVFEGMPVKNTVTYTTMLSALGQHGLGARALSLFHTMEKLGTKPDAVTFVAVISACSYSGLVDDGLAVYYSMEKFGIAATPEHHCCVVDLMGRAGRVEEAYEFVNSLGEDGNFVGIWGSLLAACKVHGKLELGKLVSERLFQLEEEYGIAGYHVLHSNLHAVEGNWDNVDRVRKEMRERGLRKVPGSSWIYVDNAAHRFNSRDQKHPENFQIYSMLQELTLEMKSSGFKTLDPCILDGVAEF